MDFEHNNLENVDDSGETTKVIKFKRKTKETFASTNSNDVNKPQSDDVSHLEGKGLFLRRKSPLLSKSGDELKVVIERDNMIVGFVDAIDSDATDDSQSEEDNQQPRRKCLKRTRSGSPKYLKKVSKEIHLMTTFSIK